MSKGKRAAH
jgi:DNA invertase Pin-like site-specific DNA recombinase